MTTIKSDIGQAEPRRRRRIGIPRSIWALGFVSMFMDISSEMIHSLLPLFMVQVLGTSMVAVGLIVGQLATRNRLHRDRAARYPSGFVRLTALRLCFLCDRRRSRSQARAPRLWIARAPAP